ncbi:MAG: DUF1616 domain-containing protein [Dehalococcoidia bacterium]|jgi:uncharacterized membrane protein
MSALNKVLLAILSAAILVTLGLIIYLQLTPVPSDRFTEFYLLNADGKAADYPSEAHAGTPLTVTLGVINHEGATASYSINVVSNGATIQSVPVPAVAQDQKWEGKTSFTLSNPGDNQTVEFYLFMDNGSQPHIKDPLLLRLNVTK